MIKDDELIADMKYNLAVPRVKAYMEKERQVYEETGEHTLYAVNITDRLPRMFDLAKEVVAAGANCIMVNYLAVGSEAMRRWPRTRISTCLSWRIWIFPVPFFHPGRASGPT
jgi:2,3-diketo-5-methylthiopentyl-1-phosphate enolase